MSATTNKFSPEVRARAVRMVLDHEGEHASRWSAVSSIAAKIGCSAHTLLEWVKKAEVDSGQWRWRAKTNYPIQSGMTPTAGGVVFFGDMGGNFYALDANDGHELWGQKIGGAVGGGVITYKAGEAQRVAVAHGLTEVLWPTEITTAKVSILGLDKTP